MRRTPLHLVHRQAGARMVLFGGWEMPLQYSGIAQEHRGVRTALGLFDVSHMGRFRASGPQALAFLQQVLPTDVGRLSPGRMAYTVLCNERGGVIDDLLVYQVAGEEYLLVVNASRTDVDLARLRERLPGQQVSLVDESRATGMLALQGPGAEAPMVELAGSRVADLPFYGCAPGSIGGQQVLVSRSGYTGEDGFEVICAADHLATIWQVARGSGAVPCGLGARDTLRTEMGYCLYGRELDEETSPLEAGLGWVLDLDKEEEFPGKAALLEEQRRGPGRVLVGLVVEERGIPRPGQAVLDHSGGAVGRVTSGTFSPSLERGVALAYLPASLAQVGTSLQIDVRGRPRSAAVASLPFVPSRIQRSQRSTRKG